MQNYPIRILHFPSSLDKHDGRMHVLMNLYKKIDRNIIQFDFVAPRSGLESFEKEIVELGGKIYWLDAKLRGDLAAIYKFSYKVMKTYPYDTMVYHNFSPWIVSLIAAKRLGIRNRIVLAHNSSWGSTKIHSLRNKMFGVPILKKATLKVGCSHFVGERIFKKDYITILNSIDPEEYRFDESERSRIRDEFGIGKNTIVVGQVARFSPEKNHRFTFNVIQSLAEQGQDVQLFLLGEGAMESDLLSLAKKLKIQSNVSFIGQQENVVPFLSAMDIFVLPSIVEGLPMVSLEAQGTGLPTLISDRVGRDCDTGRAEFLPIDNSGIKIWADKIQSLSKQQNERKGGYTDLVNSPFNMNVSAKIWQQLFVRLAKGNS